MLHVATNVTYKGADKMKKSNMINQDWLLFFYSVPSKPVNSRMKIWRMLVKSGAVQFKGSVYILPFSDDHYEFFQWLVSSVTAMKGEAAFVKVSKTETMKNSEIIELFNLQREKEYLGIVETLDGLESKLRSMKQDSPVPGNRSITEQFSKSLKEFEELGKIDFFSSAARNALDLRLKVMAPEITSRSSSKSGAQTVEVVAKRASDYQGKLWVTRKRPFIDRIASAWLIKRFIDKKATFGFIDEHEAEGLGRDAVVYDMVVGEFTHVGDLCTFEVLLRAFGLKDKALGILAEIVHQLDVKDDKYKHPAAEGLRVILDGIRKTVKDDHEALEKGRGIFEMLYASKS
jgi:hypothetical protein